MKMKLHKMQVTNLKRNYTIKGEMIMARTYECWAYKNGKPDKMVKVSANDKDEAAMLAWEKFRTIGINPDSVNVK